MGHFTFLNADHRMHVRMENDPKSKSFMPDVDKWDIPFQPSLKSKRCRGESDEKVHSLLVHIRLIFLHTAFNSKSDEHERDNSI